MKRHDVGIVAALCVLMAILLGLAIGSCVDMRDPVGPESISTATEPPPPSTAWQTTNLPPPITTAATTTVTAVRAPVQIQVSEPPPMPAPVMPVAIPGDCGSWQAIFRWYGATDEEIYFFFVTTPWGRHNVIYHESLCGVRFRNPGTSDTGICQINGVHRDWVWAEFGLRLGFGVSEAEASNPYYAAACLRLLRGESNEPNAMKYACAWRPGRFCS